MWVLSLLLLYAPPAQPVSNRAPSSCVECHRELDGPLAEPVKRSEHDVHFLKGLSCHDCHGGDSRVGIDAGGPEDSMSPARGYIGVPARSRIATLCAKCHRDLDYMRRYNPQARIDQYDEYLTSVHGKRYVAGDSNAATCTDCHGAHGIKAVKDPTSAVYPTNVADTCARCHSDRLRMKPYNIPVNQLELYSRSVHGESLIKNRDISAPTCNDCHGNHGASPPGVDSVANACGQCHVSQWDLFGRSPHRQAFAEAGFPACVTCHRHHDVARTSDSMLGVEEGATCLDCHDSDSRGYQVAAEMRSGILGLNLKLEEAQQVLGRAERAGMEVSRPLFDLVEGRDRLVRARVEIHGFDLAAFRKVLSEGEGIAEGSRLSGERALEELAFRRKGLTVSAVIIVAMIGLLLLKIRQIEKPEPSDTGEAEPQRPA